MKNQNKQSESEEISDKPVVSHVRNIFVTILPTNIF